jgi:ABC-2 type transport system ATP-binding protein
MSDVAEYPRTRLDERNGRDAGQGLLAIATEGLVRRYGEATAVDGIDLAIERGEIFGFLGPNGAGKSTLIRVLCTLLRPSAGSASVAGFDVSLQPTEVRLRIGVALQEAALDPYQTGRELLALQGRLYGLGARQIRSRLDEVLDLVDIADAIDRRIATYSGGMKRRLDLAAALVHGPEVLFLDEPTTGLDPESRGHVWSEVQRLNRELGLTIFLTTQYLEEADALAGRIGVIHRGRLIAQGSPADLKRSVGDDLIVAEVTGRDDRALDDLRALAEVTDATRHGDRIVVATPDAAATISAVALQLNGSDLAVRSLTLRSPTLDDVFRELTGTLIETEVGV